MSEEKWKCPKCGAENAMDDNFCGECGGKKPVVGIGIAQTIEKPEKVETSYTSVDDLELKEPKKKGVGKIAVIVVAICVVCVIVLAVIELQYKEKQRIEAEERARGNLIWSDRSSNEINWSSAKEYCKNLSEGGYTDWRLPNIDELRTLIQNHSGTQSGGSCPISEKAGKLAGRDWTNDCRTRDGSNFSKLGDVGWFWSSSTLSDNPDFAWRVDFDFGNVYGHSKSYHNYVRCVR